MNEWDVWNLVCQWCEWGYNTLIEMGAKPQEARSVLPNSLETRIFTTFNLREWRHVFKLRALGTTGKPHPQMVEVMEPLLIEFKNSFPVFFEDLSLE
jgi:thymidylate synthase (FAD)